MAEIIVTIILCALSFYFGRIVERKDWNKKLNAIKQEICDTYKDINRHYERINKAYKRDIERYRQYIEQCNERTRYHKKSIQFINDFDKSMELMRASKAKLKRQRSELKKARRNTLN